MTKEEVLQGALALNGNDKKYTVTVEGDRIITEVKYATRSTTNVFRSVACLNDDNTYVELHKHIDNDDGHVQFGKVIHKYTARSLYIKNGMIQSENEHFNSEDYKKIVRDYLESCGYKRTNKGFFKRLFGKR